MFEDIYYNDYFNQTQYFPYLGDGVGIIYFIWNTYNGKCYAIDGVTGERLEGVK